MTISVNLYDIKIFILNLKFQNRVEKFVVLKQNFEIPELLNDSDKIKLSFHPLLSDIQHLVEGVFSLEATKVPLKEQFHRP